MPTLLLTSAAAFVFSLALTPGLRWWLRRREPRRRRNGEAGPPVPRLGGVAVWAAAAAALALGAGLHWGFASPSNAALLRQLAPPLALMVLVGAADDWWDLTPGWKFAGEFAAAAWAAGSGLRVAEVFHQPLPPWLGVVIAVLWLVGCANAFNLIDGLDGLATGLALFATGTVLAHAVLIGEPGLALAMGVLFGALAGFLRFNFPPASIYLGDAGSLSIGFWLGCMALAWANKATTMLGLIAPFFALSVPMLDTGTAILRRGLSGRPLFTGDRQHIHHRLLGRGLAPRTALMSLYAVAGVGAAISLLLADRRQRQSYELVLLLFALLFSALLGVGIQQLGYLEFTAAGRLLWRGWRLRGRAVQTQVRLAQWGADLAAAADAADVWTRLCQIARELNFHGVEFRAGPAAPPSWRGGQTWTDLAHAPPASNEFCGWSCQFPLEEGQLGTVTFWHVLDATDDPGLVTDLAAVLRTQLIPCLRLLQGAPAPRSAAAGRH